MAINTIFPWLDVTGYYFFHCLFLRGYYSGRLLFESSIYFFGKPADINDCLIRYIWVRQWRLLNAVSSKHSLSVLLSAVEMTRTTRTALVLAWWPSPEYFKRVCMLHILATATIRRWCLFLSELQGGICSKKYSSYNFLFHSKAHPPRTIPENTSSLRHVLLLFLLHKCRSYR